MRTYSLMLGACVGVAGLGATAAAAPAGARGVPAPTVLGGQGHATVYASGMEVAPDGTLVVADTGNDSVAKFTAGGKLLWRVPAGVAEGDEAENARDIAVDDNGFIYVADAAEFRIIKLDPVDGHTIRWFNGPSGDRLGSPIGITAKKNKIYVSDGAKKKVRVFDANGTQLQVFTATGACDLSAVRDADADAVGNVYVANYKNNNIVKFSPTGACLTTWGSQGTANGQFKNPYGVRVARDPKWGEVVYVADSNNDRVQVFSKTGALKAVVGKAGAFNQTGTFTTLRRVAVAPDGDIWGADLWGWRLVRFDRTATGYAYAQTIGGQAPPLTNSAVFNEPRAVAVGTDGNLNIMDTVNQRVVTMTKSGTVLGACGQRDYRPISVNWPRGVAIDPVTGDRWIADTKQSRLQIFPTKCGLQTYRLGNVGTATQQFTWPYAIAIRPSDRLAFVADTQNNRVTVWDVATRSALGTYTGLKSPRAIAVDAATKNLVVADAGNARIVTLSYSKAAGFAAVSTITPAGLSMPEGVARAADGNYWIGDTGNNRIVIATPSGTIVETITTAAGKAISKPTSITAVGGAIYVSDTNNDRVLVYGS
ncbi:MAG TPA: hypothetical protein PKH97_03070 [Tetrasphaera sp.]|uniref:hypothetical protein n=1 Tax=Nostocoides sp. TaxID=1917966 RepID=UPI002D027FC6|nr:hypothetical protein [Tetrasphaera sp.]HNQ06148.1 hypothetical protein [Tetrasphaera sp.]